MSGPVKELNVRAAIQYSLECKALRDREWADATAQDFAALLIAGHRGAVLEKLLHEHHARTPRGVVYGGIGIAMTWHQGNLAVSQLEARILRDKLAEAGIEA